MGKFTPRGLSGLVGTVVAYNMRGKNFLRARPSTLNRKKDAVPIPTRAVFGLVSRFGSAMTKGIKNQFLFPFDLLTYNGVRGWMRNYFIQRGEGASFSAPPLCCQLNPECDLRDHFPPPVSAVFEGGTISVTVPSFNPLQLIKAPAGTTHVHFKIVAISTKFEEAAIAGKTIAESVRIEYSDYPLSLLPVKLNMAERTGHIALVVMALEFEVNGKMVTDKEWLPAAAIAVGKMNDE